MTNPDTRKKPYLQRPCLLVSNIDRSLGLYRDLLGFAVEYVSVDEPDSYSYDIFNIPREIQTRFATLSTPDQLRTLALIEVPGAKIQTTSLLTAAIVINVSDVDALIARAKDLGFDTLPGRIHPAPKNGPGRKEAALYDPDGHPVVIYELTEAG